MKLTNEAKVGGLVLGTGILALVFAWAIGVENPFQQSQTFYVTYNFAGGIEVGSPVRVSGIKVGKVERIEFFVSTAASKVGIKEPGSAEGEASVSAADPDSKAVLPLRMKVSVRKDAALGLRENSRFYINLAGIIGERYIEITPGTFGAPRLQAGATVAGVDPPRIDQLLSQSFDLAGKIADIIEENKGDLARSLDLIYKLSGSLNKTLAWVDKSAVFKTDLAKLVDNLIVITQDVKKITSKMGTPEGEKTQKLLYELLWRLEPLDSKTIRTFLQKEGMKVHLF